jgi:hypothetical protein
MAIEYKMNKTPNMPGSLAQYSLGTLLMHEAERIMKEDTVKYNPTKAASSYKILRPFYR